MRTASLGPEAQVSQMFVRNDCGEILREMRIPTNWEQLRRAVSEVSGQKYVVSEAGPLSSMVIEALQDLAEGIAYIMFRSVTRPVRNIALNVRASLLFLYPIVVSVL